MRDKKSKKRKKERNSRIRRMETKSHNIQKKKTIKRKEKKRGDTKLVIMVH